MALLPTRDGRVAREQRRSRNEAADVYLTLLVHRQAGPFGSGAGSVNRIAILVDNYIKINIIK